MQLLFNLPDCCSHLISGLINHFETSHNSTVAPVGFVEECIKRPCRRAVSCHYGVGSTLLRLQRLSIAEKIN